MTIVVIYNCEKCSNNYVFLILSINVTLNVHGTLMKRVGVAANQQLIRTSPVMGQYCFYRPAFYLPCQILPLQPQGLCVVRVVYCCCCWPTGGFICGCCSRNGGKRANLLIQSRNKD